MEQLLALGSVVRVRTDEQTTLRMVIAGYFPCDTASGTTYDYSAVLYPWGMQVNPALQMFNRGQIVSVEHEGYRDEDGRKMTQGILQALEEYRRGAERLIREYQERDAAPAGEKSDRTGEKPDRTEELEEFG